MVSVLREKFAQYNLTFSIGGQISFDVSNFLCVLDFHIMLLCTSQNVLDLGFPARVGQNILLEIPRRVSRSSLLRRQDLQGCLAIIQYHLNPLFFFSLFFLSFFLLIMKSDLLLFL